MKFILIFFTAISFSFEGAIPSWHNFVKEPHFEIEGTWKTIPRENDYGPKVEVTINRDSIFISKTHIGSGGYKQLLTYKRSNDTIYATEKEIMFFDQNIGYISRHFKYRKHMIRLDLTQRDNQNILVLDPFVEGGVLSKVSDHSNIDYNFDEQFSKWRLGRDFECDYKKNGRPKPSASGHGE